MSSDMRRRSGVIMRGFLWNPGLAIGNNLIQCSTEPRAIDSHPVFNFLAAAGNTGDIPVRHYRRSIHRWVCEACTRLRGPRCEAITAKRFSSPSALRPARALRRERRSADEGDEADFGPRCE